MATIRAGTTLGPYEIVHELAHGDTTDLLLARSRGMAGFERYVVVKRVRDDREVDAAFVQVFRDEARVAAALHHHNIVQVHDTGDVDGRPYFTMEYIAGEDIRKLLVKVKQRGEQLPTQHLIAIGQAVANALHYAHEQRSPDGKPLGLVHRDVSPVNIIVGYDGNIKVVDFGMAKAAITAVTQVGTKKGKAAYMSPEQCAGEKVDRRCDVFALGVTLYEMATVRRLFKGATDIETMSTIANGTIPRPSEVRPDLAKELEAIIMKALARLPNDRYQTAAELGRALETYAEVTGLMPSTTGLAAYMKQLFGEWKEPWLVGGAKPRADKNLDFDDGLGVAFPSADPIKKPEKKKALPSIVGAAPAPVMADEATTVDAKPEAKEDAKEEAKPAAATAKLGPTAFVFGEARKKATLPPPVAAKAEPKPEPAAEPAKPEAAEGTKAKPEPPAVAPPGVVVKVDGRGDKTELVTPLPLPSEEVRPAKQDRRWLYAAGGGIAVVIGIIVIAFARGGGNGDAAPAAPAAASESAPSEPTVGPPSPGEPEPEPAAPPTPTTPPAPEPVAAPPPPPAPPPVPPPMPEPAVAPAPPPPPHIAPKPHPKPQPTAVVATKKPAPAKPAKKKPAPPPALKYDPNSLFLKGK